MNVCVGSQQIYKLDAPDATYLSAPGIPSDASCSPQPCSFCSCQQHRWCYMLIKTAHKREHRKERRLPRQKAVMATHEGLKEKYSAGHRGSISFCA